MTLDEIEKAFRRGCCSETRLAKEGCDVCGPQMEAIAAVRKMAAELEAINAPFHGGALHHIEKLHDDQRESRDREEALVLKLEAAERERDTAHEALGWLRKMARPGFDDGSSPLARLLRIEGAILSTTADLAEARRSDAEAKLAALVEAADFR